MRNLLTCFVFILCLYKNVINILKKNNIVYSSALHSIHSLIFKITSKTKYEPIITFYYRLHCFGGAYVSIKNTPLAFRIKVFCSQRKIKSTWHLQ